MIVYMFMMMHTHTHTKIGDLFERFWTNKSLNRIRIPFL